MAFKMLCRVYASEPRCGLLLQLVTSCPHSSAVSFLVTLFKVSMHILQIIHLTHQQGRSFQGIIKQRGY